VSETERTAIVLQGTGGLWHVLCDDGARFDVSMRGRLKHERHEARPNIKLAVGDHVVITRDTGSSTWAINEIRPRVSQLARRNPSGARGERVVVANLDQVVVVFAAARPEPHPRMLDRFLVIAEANGLHARIVINKCDLVDAAIVHAMFDEYAAIGYPLHLTSVITGTGIDELREVIAARCSALSGPSGVGKSSLMNRLYPGLDLRTGAISDSVNKGRHTTVGAVLHPLPDGGFVADTPGLREVGLWNIPAPELAVCFPEYRDLVDECRFADCTHRVEPGCAVRDAVDAGQVSRGRYESYQKLYDEMAADSTSW
jgi:ribosome biogenesis GTPase